MKLFYCSESGRIGDVIPYYDEDTGRMRPFHLGTGGWHVLDTVDNLNFSDKLVGIRGGTGSVVKVRDTWHLFYCTFQHDPERQYACHAVSDDFNNWTPVPEHTFTADGVIYKTTDWRDPHVFWNEADGKWWMLIAARENARTERNGCVGLCVSDDLINWEYRKPLYSPHSHMAAYECPDIFQIGEWYYLVYSNYTDGFRTYYRMSKSPDGPWLRPDVDTFDTRCFYAGKTGTDGQHRYIYAWNPTRERNIWKINPQTDIGQDYNTWDWGGTMEVHRLVQRHDGTLGVAPPDAVNAALTKRIDLSPRALEGEWQIDGVHLSIDSPYGYSSALLGKVPELCKLELDITYTGNPSRFGVALQVDDAFAQGYYLCFEPFHRRVQVRTGLRMHEDGGKMFPYDIEAERPFSMEPGKTYHLRIFVQDSILLLYVDSDIALSYRMFNFIGREFGLFVADGGIRVECPSLFVEGD